MYFLGPCVKKYGRTENLGDLKECCKVPWFAYICAPQGLSLSKRVWLAVGFGCAMCILHHKIRRGGRDVAGQKGEDGKDLRPCLSIFKATGSPCHESTSRDNFNSTEYLTRQKGKPVRRYIASFRHRWHCQQRHYLSSSSTNTLCDTLN